MGNSDEEEVAVLAPGRAGMLFALVVLVIGLAVMPSLAAATLLAAGPFAGPGPHADLTGQILQSLNILRLGTGAGLLLALPLLRGER